MKTFKSMPQVPPELDPNTDEMEAFRRSLTEGDEVVIYSTDWTDPRCELTTVLSTKRGRIYTAHEVYSRGKGRGAPNAWFMKSGLSCNAPTGQASLIMFSEAIRPLMTSGFLEKTRPKQLKSDTRNDIPWPTHKPEATYTYEEFVKTDERLRELNTPQQGIGWGIGPDTRAIDTYLLKCKKEGILEYTDKEWLIICLDHAHPNAKSKEVVIYEGKKYRRRFVPANRSNSGKTVYGWLKLWDALDT